MGVCEEDRLLEIYKLHADLADRVSQRRGEMHRLYVSLHAGLIVLGAALIRFGFGDVPQDIALLMIACLGALFSISWTFAIIPYRQLNKEKFRVLQELEAKLPFQFFTKEWDAKGIGKKSNRYWKMTLVETWSLPSIFLLVYIALAVHAMCS